MNYRIPSTIGNKRNNSIHLKKLPNQYALYEDTEISRLKSSTPNNILKTFQKSESISLPSKNLPNYPVLETPEPPRKIIRKHNISLADIRHINYASSPDKFYSMQKSNKLDFKFSQEKVSLCINDINKNNEKHKSLLDVQKNKIDKLKNKIQKLKASKSELKQSPALKNLKSISKALKVAVGAFVKIVREEIDKICSIVIEKELKYDELEVTKIQSVFNKGIQHLCDVMGEKAEKWKFVGIDKEKMLMTGKFKSLEETQGDWKAVEEKKVIKEVVALSKFEPTDYGQLSFNQGDRIQILKTDDINWWLGKINEKIGRFPSKLVMLD